MEVGGLGEGVQHLTAPHPTPNSCNGQEMEQKLCSPNIGGLMHHFCDLLSPSPPLPLSSSLSLSHSLFLSVL